MFSHTSLTCLPVSCRASKRLLLLDYDGTLIDQSAIDCKPTAEVLKVVQGLCADPNNFVFIISGRARSELASWFDPKVSCAQSLSSQMTCSLMPHQLLVLVSMIATTQPHFASAPCACQMCKFRTAAECC